MQLQWHASNGESPLLFNNHSLWEGLCLNHWAGVAGALTDYTPSDHVVSFALAGEMISCRHDSFGTKCAMNAAAGSMCVIPAGQTIEANWPSRIECLSISLKPAWLLKAADDLGAVRPVRLDEVCATDDPLLKYIALALLQEGNATQPTGRLYGEALAHALTLHVLRHYGNVPGLDVRKSGGLTPRTLRRALDFVEANLAADISLTELAASVDLSSFHFSRAFKRSTGQTPQQFVTQRRIELAKQLLAESELPLVDVGLAVGFKNQSHFTTLFRKFTSTTPKVWRATRAQ